MKNRIKVKRVVKAPREFDVKCIELNDLEDLVIFCNKMSRVDYFDHPDFYKFKELRKDLRCLTKEAILSYVDGHCKEEDCFTSVGSAGYNWLCLYIASYFGDSYDEFGSINIFKFNLILDFLLQNSISWFDIATLVKNMDALSLYFRYRRDDIYDEYDSIDFRYDYFSDIEFYLKKYAK